MKNKTKRNYEIYSDYLDGMTLFAIKRKYDVSLKQINKIIKREEKKSARSYDEVEDTYDEVVEDMVETAPVIFQDMAEVLSGRYPDIHPKVVLLGVISVCRHSLKHPELPARGVFLRFNEAAFNKYLKRFVDEGGLDEIGGAYEDSAKKMLHDEYHRLYETVDHYFTPRHSGRYPWPGNVA